MPMHKRILCLILAAVLLLSIIPVLAVPSRAASNLKTSEACITMLKNMEGFLKYPVFDYSQYSVGYGSACNKDDYPDGITVEEADALLRAYVVELERALKIFADRYDILFSQNQFDALILFTYNCGPNWVNSDGEFRRAVIENKAGNHFIYAATLWSSAGNQLHMGILERRLLESNLYLNGKYGNQLPSNFTYVVYNNQGGIGESRAQGYDCNYPACVKSAPTREGYRFLGWYSAANGGSWITELTAANAKQTLYAHWQGMDVTATTGTAAAYQIPSEKLVSLEIFDGPGGNVVGTLSRDAVANVEADYVDQSGMKWGRIRTGKWVKLGDPRKGTFDETATEEETGVQVMVTGDYVNVRTGPGTKYQAVSGVVQGEALCITEVVDLSGTLWGKFRGGWICLQYTNYSGGLTPGKHEGTPEVPQPDSGDPIDTGVVTADLLNIRASAGTHGALQGCYERNDKVTILEKATVSGTPWGRTDRGWICLSYVRLDSEQSQETVPPTEPEVTEPEATEPESTEPGTTGPDEEQKETSGGIPGTVISKTGLNVRQGPGTNFAVTASYKSGEKIRILEQKTVSGVAWGRTDKGWVCMQYIQLQDNWSDANGISAVVTSAGGLNIRSGPGVGYAPVGNYTSGERIVILQQTSVSGQKWGRTDKGWVCMTYVKLEQSVQVPNEQPETMPPETTSLKPLNRKPQNRKPPCPKQKSRPVSPVRLLPAD